MPLAIQKPAEHPWRWFTDKVLGPLIVALCVAVAGGVWSIYRKIDEFSQSMTLQQREIDLLKSRVSNVESAMVTKTELLETMKRVEQQLEIYILREKVKR